MQLFNVEVWCSNRGAEIYVTHFPCLQCCKAIIQSGIKTVYYAVSYKNHPYAIELFKQAGVAVEYVELVDMPLDVNSQEKRNLYQSFWKSVYN